MSEIYDFNGWDAYDPYKKFRTQNYGSYAFGAILRIMDNMKLDPHSELWIICARALLSGENKLLVHRKMNLICLYLDVIIQSRLDRNFIPIK